MSRRHTPVEEVVEMSDRSTYIRRSLGSAQRTDKRQLRSHIIRANHTNTRRKVYVQGPSCPESWSLDISIGVVTPRLARKKIGTTILRSPCETECRLAASSWLCPIRLSAGRKVNADGHITNVRGRAAQVSSKATTPGAPSSTRR